MAGHAIVLGLVSLIFYNGTYGGCPQFNPMTGFSVVLIIFIYFIEMLVAYIQALCVYDFSRPYSSMEQGSNHQKPKNLSNQHKYWNFKEFTNKINKKQLCY